MNGREFIALLTKLEQSFPINSLSVEQAHIWPLVRIQLNTTRKYGTKIPNNKTAIACLRRAITSYFHFLRDSLLSRKQRKMLQARFAAAKAQVAAAQERISQLPQRRYLALVLEKEHFHQIQGQPYAPLLDSLITLTEAESGRRDFLKLALAWNISSPYVATEVISPDPFLAISAFDSYLAPTRLRSLFVTVRLCIWLARLSRTMSKGNSSYVIDAELLLKRLVSYRGQREYFSRILDAIQPQAVLMTSYTGRLAFVCAAKRRGIPVVDVQHGGMHAQHPLAAHWSAIPRGGYDYLPDYFWCWTQETADIVTRTCTPVDHAPKAIVGGNPWQLLCTSSHRTNILTPCEEIFISQLATETRPIILIALQYGHDAYLEDHVTSFIKRNTDQYKWLFRLHPMGHDQAVYLTQEFGEIVSSEEIDLATNVPLHLLLPYTDRLITKFSTICREALEHGVPTIFVDPRALTVFESEIQRGIASYAGDEETLHQQLVPNDRLSEEMKGLRTERQTTQLSTILTTISSQFLESQRDTKRRRHPAPLLPG